jgi:hypothetical protein
MSSGRGGGCPAARRQPHALEIGHELLCDLGAEPAADLELLGRRRAGGGHLGRERRIGRHLGGIRGEIVDDDAVGPGELCALVALALRDFGRCAPRHDNEGEQQCSGTPEHFHD